MAENRRCVPASKPTINFRQKFPTLIREGDAGSVTVEVNGYPPPTVKWYLGDNQLNNSEDFTIKSTGFLHSLWIRNAPASINRLGISVVATNTLGEEQTPLEIVTYKVLRGHTLNQRSRSQTFRTPDSMLLQRRKKIVPIRRGQSLCSLGSVSSYMLDQIGHDSSFGVVPTRSAPKAAPEEDVFLDDTTTTSPQTTSPEASFFIHDQSSSSGQDASFIEPKISTYTSGYYIGSGLQSPPTTRDHRDLRNVATFPREVKYQTAQEVTEERGRLARRTLSSTENLFEVVQTPSIPPLTFDDYYIPSSPSIVSTISVQSVDRKLVKKKLKKAKRKREKSSEELSSDLTNLEASSLAGPTPGDEQTPKGRTLDIQPPDKDLQYMEREDTELQHIGQEVHTTHYKETNFGIDYETSTVTQPSGPAAVDTYTNPDVVDIVSSEKLAGDQVEETQVKPKKKKKRKDSDKKRKLKHSSRSISSSVADDDSMMKSMDSITTTDIDSVDFGTRESVTSTERDSASYSTRDSITSYESQGLLYSCSDITDVISGQDGYDFPEPGDDFRDPLLPNYSSYGMFANKTTGENEHWRDTNSAEPMMTDQNNKPDRIDPFLFSGNNVERPSHASYNDIPADKPASLSAINTDSQNDTFMETNLDDIYIPSPKQGRDFTRHEETAQIHPIPQSMLIETSVDITTDITQTDIRDNIGGIAVPASPEKTKKKKKKKDGEKKSKRSRSSHSIHSSIADEDISKSMDTDRAQRKPNAEHEFGKDTSDTHGTVMTTLTTGVAASDTVEMELNMAEERLPQGTYTNIKETTIAHHGAPATVERTKEKIKKKKKETEGKRHKRLSRSLHSVRSTRVTEREYTTKSMENVSNVDGTKSKTLIGDSGPATEIDYAPATVSPVVAMETDIDNGVVEQTKTALILQSPVLETCIDDIGVDLSGKANVLALPDKEEKKEKKKRRDSSKERKKSRSKLSLSKESQSGEASGGHVTGPQSPVAETFIDNLPVAAMETCIDDPPVGAMETCIDDPPVAAMETCIDDPPVAVKENDKKEKKKKHRDSSKERKKSRSLRSLNGKVKSAKSTEEKNVLQSPVMETCLDDIQTSTSPHVTSVLVNSPLGEADINNTLMQSPVLETCIDDICTPIDNQTRPYITQEHAITPEVSQTDHTESNSMQSPVTETCIDDIQVDIADIITPPVAAVEEVPKETRKKRRDSSKERKKSRSLRSLNSKVSQSEDGKVHDISGQQPSLSQLEDGKVPDVIALQPSAMETCVDDIQIDLPPPVTPSDKDLKEKKKKRRDSSKERKKNRSLRSLHAKDNQPETAESNVSTDLQSTSMETSINGLQTDISITTDATVTENEKDTTKKKKKIKDSSSKKKKLSRSLHSLHSKFTPTENATKSMEDISTVVQADITPGLETDVVLPVDASDVVVIDRIKEQTVINLGQQHPQSPGMETCIDDMETDISATIDRSGMEPDIEKIKKKKKIKDSSKHKKISRSLHSIHSKFSPSESTTKSMENISNVKEEAHLTNITHDSVDQMVIAIDTGTPIVGTKKPADDRLTTNETDIDQYTRETVVMETCVDDMETDVTRTLRPPVGADENNKTKKKVKKSKDGSKQKKLSRSLHSLHSKVKHKENVTKSMEDVNTTSESLRSDYITSDSFGTTMEESNANIKQDLGIPEEGKPKKIKKKKDGEKKKKLSRSLRSIRSSADGEEDQTTNSINNVIPEVKPPNECVVQIPSSRDLIETNVDDIMDSTVAALEKDISKKKKKKKEGEKKSKLSRSLRSVLSSADDEKLADRVGPVGGESRFLDDHTITSPAAPHMSDPSYSHESHAPQSAPVPQPESQYHDINIVLSNGKEDVTTDTSTIAMTPRDSYDFDTTSSTDIKFNDSDIDKYLSQDSYDLGRQRLLSDSVMSESPSVVTETSENIETGMVNTVEIDQSKKTKKRKKESTKGTKKKRSSKMSSSSSVTAIDQDTEQAELPLYNETTGKEGRPPIYSERYQGNILSDNSYLSQYQSDDGPSDFQDGFSKDDTTNTSINITDSMIQDKTDTETSNIINDQVPFDSSATLDATTIDKPVKKKKKKKDGEKSAKTSKRKRSAKPDENIVENTEPDGIVVQSDDIVLTQDLVDILEKDTKAVKPKIKAKKTKLRKSKKSSTCQSDMDIISDVVHGQESNVEVPELVKSPNENPEELTDRNIDQETKTIMGQMWRSLEGHDGITEDTPVAEVDFEENDLKTISEPSSMDLSTDIDSQTSYQDDKTNQKPETPENKSSVALGTVQTDEFLDNVFIRDNYRNETSAVESRSVPPYGNEAFTPALDRTTDLRHYQNKSNSTDHSNNIKTLREKFFTENQSPSWSLPKDDRPQVSKVIPKSVTFAPEEMNDTLEIPSRSDSPERQSIVTVKAERLQDPSQCKLLGYTKQTKTRVSVTEEIITIARNPADNSSIAANQSWEELLESIKFIDEGDDEGDDDDDDEVNEGNGNVTKTVYDTKQQNIGSRPATVYRKRTTTSYDEPPVVKEILSPTIKRTTQLNKTDLPSNRENLASTTSTTYRDSKYVPGTTARDATNATGLREKVTVQSPTRNQRFAESKMFERKESLTSDMFSESERVRNTIRRETENLSKPQMFDPAQKKSEDVSESSEPGTEIGDDNHTINQIWVGTVSSDTLRERLNRLASAQKPHALSGLPSIPEVETRQSPTEIRRGYISPKVTTPTSPGSPTMRPRGSVFSRISRHGKTDNHSPDSNTTEITSPPASQTSPESRDIVLGKVTDFSERPFIPGYRPDLNSDKTFPTTTSPTRKRETPTEETSLPSHKPRSGISSGDSKESTTSFSPTHREHLTTALNVGRPITTTEYSETARGVDTTNTPSIPTERLRYGDLTLSREQIKSILSREQAKDIPREHVVDATMPRTIPTDISTVQSREKPTEENGSQPADKIRQNTGGLIITPSISSRGHVSSLIERRALATDVHRRDMTDKVSQPENEKTSKFEAPPGEYIITDSYEVSQYTFRRSRRKDDDQTTRYSTSSTSSVDSEILNYVANIDETIPNTTEYYRTISGILPPSPDPYCKYRYRDTYNDSPPIKMDKIDGPETPVIMVNETDECQYQHFITVPKSPADNTDISPLHERSYFTFSPFENQSFFTVSSPQTETLNSDPGGRGQVADHVTILNGTDPNQETLYRDNKERLASKTRIGTDREESISDGIHSPPITQHQHEQTFEIPGPEPLPDSQDKQPDERIDGDRSDTSSDDSSTSSALSEGVEEHEYTVTDMWIGPASALPPPQTREVGGLGISDYVTRALSQATTVVEKDNVRDYVVDVINRAIATMEREMSAEDAESFSFNNRLPTVLEEDECSSSDESSPRDISTHDSRVQTHPVAAQQQQDGSALQTGRQVADRDTLPQAPSDIHTASPSSGDSSQADLADPHENKDNSVVTAGESLSKTNGSGDMNRQSSFRASDVDSDVTLEKSYLSSVAGNLGSILFLLLAILVCHLLDMWVKMHQWE